MKPFRYVLLLLLLALPAQAQELVIEGWSPATPSVATPLTWHFPSGLSRPLDLTPQLPNPHDSRGDVEGSHRSPQGNYPPEAARLDMPPRWTIISTR